MKKVIPVLLALFVALSALAGCGSGGAQTTTAAATTAQAATTAAAATTEAAAATTAAATTAGGAAAEATTTAAAAAEDQPVAAELAPLSLVYYIAATEQTDSATVQAAMDAYLTEKLNCTLTIVPIQSSEWNTKMPLIYSAGEQVDLAFDQANRGYYTNAANGVYHPLNDLFAQYGQGAAEQMEINTPGLIDAPKIGGVLYGVPCEKQTAQCEAWYFRKDIADEIGLDVETLVTLQDLEPYLLKIKETHPEMTPYYVSTGSGIHTEWATDAIKDNLTKYEELNGAVNLLLVDLEQDKVLNHYETEWDLDRYQTLKRWQDTGLINPDAATTTTGGGDIFRAGKTWLIGGGGAPTTLSSYQSGYGTDFYRWRATGPIMNTYQNTTALTCIPRTALDPARSMMLINLFHTDKEYVDMFNSGIEGKHHVTNADGKFELPPGASSKNDTGYAYGFETFFGNMFLNTLWYNEKEDRYTELREYNQAARKSKILGFYVDMANITTEYAAVEAVRTQYAPILKAGVSPDVAATLKEMNDKMYANGLQKVIDEAQRQYDEFIATVGKTE
ncbi:MAG: ABC transporter substrate-binding protein [Clostridiales bacterium]|nr:ABC transporter substrate-binding protein [Clostridiales bacterium]